MTLTYDTARPISADAFIDLLKRSTLAERRPIDDHTCIATMLQHTNLLCTAWDGETLVGVARSVTDFAFCCYLSDLAVAETHQHHGIGRELIRLTQKQLGPRAKLILLAAPKAEGYYPRLGFTAHHSAWMIPADRPLR